MNQTTVAAQYEVWVCKFKDESDPAKLTADRVIAWIVLGDEQDQGVPPVPVGRNLGALWNSECTYQIAFGPKYTEAIERARKVIAKSGVLSMGVRKMIEQKMSAYDVAVSETLQWRRQAFAIHPLTRSHDRQEIKWYFDGIAEEATKYHQEWAAHAGPDAHGYADKAVS